MVWGRKYLSQCRRFGQIKLDSSLIGDPPVTLFSNVVNGIDPKRSASFSNPNGFEVTASLSCKSAMTIYPTMVFLKKTQRPTEIASERAIIMKP